MPLANIAFTPTEGAEKAFDYSHYQDHVEIAQKLKLPIYPIHPAPSKDDAWKRQHQAFHDDMNAAIKSNGSDLTGEIDNSWYNQNYREHSNVRVKLGI